MKRISNIDVKKTSPILLFIMLVSPCLIFYLPSFGYFFAQDDFYFLSHVFEHRLDSPVSMLRPIGPFYRPLTTTIYFALMSGLFGLRAVPYHVFSLAVFCGNVFLVYHIGKALFRSNRGGFAMALFYLTRVVHFETVSWISGVQDLVMTFFVLMSLILYLRWSQGRGRCWYCSLGVFVLALLSKETAVVFPFFLLAYEVIVNRARPGRGRWAVLSSFFLVDALFVLFRSSIVQPIPKAGEYATGVGLFWVSNMVDYFMACINILFLPFIVLPGHRHYFPQVLLLVFGVILFLLFFVKRDRRGVDVTSAASDWEMDIRNRMRYAIFGLTIFLFGSMPAWQFKNRFEPYYMSLACVGICIVLTAALSLFSSRRLRTALLMGACVLALIMSIRIRAERLSHVAKFSPVAKRAINELRPLVSASPSGTTLFVAGADEYLWHAFRGETGIKVFFSNIESVVFDGKSPDYQLDGSEIVYRYTSGRVSSESE